ncbi:MAG: XRE family transcriptional regulator [Acidobacteriales bacterium]|nr:XRE family transcriptional regulator [Terriglobales bacterium]
MFEFRSPPVNGKRIRQARELGGMTQTVLADALGIDQTMIAHLERGTKQPAFELLEALSVELGFPVSFFCQTDAPEFPAGSLLFRSKAGIGRKVVAQAHAHTELVFELVLRLSASATLIPVTLPSIQDAIEGARDTRNAMRLDDGPIPNLVRAVERLGVLVVPLPDLKDCDAFAVWAGPNREYPVIGLVVSKPPDRIRMNIAHELGHLVLHKQITGGTLEQESEAYRFAAELLMPANAITDDLKSERLTLFRLAALKIEWQVSMQALARRARELQVMSDRQYRYLMQQIATRGWRTSEPEFRRLPEEKPRALRRLIEVVFGPKTDFKQLGAELHLGSDFIADVVGACASSPDQSKEKLPSRRKAGVVSFCNAKRK